ncbi:hypothetical protein [Halorientalis pallida]|uniref:Uncharacterized protein n=1 Tax=Halorientalis pallida TaxID=2479928 RepID=A0A498L387_9EURY|nr:hypothetical protein [Halorientalis pallida]RXK48475.1 hypothetical protein EAF64_12400 [Halorientalis pallida]
MGDSDDREVYLELYRQSISEAHRSMDRQFELFETNRAALERVLQLTTILLGLLLTAGTFAWELDGFEVSPFVNPYTLAGLGFLLGSFAAGTFGFRFHSQIIGIGPQSLAFVATAFDEEATPPTEPASDFQTIRRLVVAADDASPAEHREEFYVWLTREYGKWIERNERVNAKKSLSTMLVILLLLAALAALTLGVLDAVLGALPLWVRPVTALALLVVTWVSGVPQLIAKLYLPYT